MSLVVNPWTARLARFLSRAGLGTVNRAAKSLLRRLSRGGKLRVRAGDFEFEGPVESWRVLSQIAAGGLEPYESALFLSALEPGMTVLDAGANIGYYAAHAARAVGPGGHVHAFEPDPRTAHSLRANMLRNGLENVTVHEYAVSASAGSRELILSGTASHSGLSRTMDETTIVGSTTVEAVALDDVLGGVSVDVMKMDVEGEEPYVLLGMERTLAASPRLRLFLEFSPASLEAAGSSAPEFLATLRSLFDRVEIIDEGERRLVEATEERLTERRNVLCSRTPSD